MGGLGLLGGHGGERLDDDQVVVGGVLLAGVGVGALEDGGPPALLAEQLVAGDLVELQVGLVVDLGGLVVEAADHRETDLVLAVAALGTTLDALELRCGLHAHNVSSGSIHGKVRTIYIIANNARKVNRVNYSPHLLK